MLERYAKATAGYDAASVLELERLRGALPTHHYIALRKRVDQARRFADTARQALQRHIAEHRCGSLAFDLLRVEGSAGEVCRRA